MNKPLRKLQFKAYYYAKIRGHSLGDWYIYNNDQSAIAACKFCGLTAIVNVQPLPNDIDIGGSAIALYCNRESATVDNL